VLIVEDHELLAGTLSLALRQRGALVEVAAGPGTEDVIGTARRMAPVLVLLDLELGDLGSGLDLVEPLIGAGSTVVMLTGVTDQVRLAACVEAGAVGIISKTVPFDDLVAAVDRALAGEELLSFDERQTLLAELRTSRRDNRERLAPFAALTPREQAVLARLVAGEAAETIAAGSYVSLATVRSQIRSILLKLGVNSQLAAVAMARAADWPPKA
jgi:two-component system nitrate/nitrite response regulator NarL